MSLVSVVTCARAAIVRDREFSLVESVWPVFADRSCVQTSVQRPGPVRGVCFAAILVMDVSWLREESSVSGTYPDSQSEQRLRFRHGDGARRNKPEFLKGFNQFNEAFFKGSFKLIELWSPKNS